MVDAEVDVTATTDGGSRSLGPGAAFNSPLHPNSYELTMDVSTPGQWSFKIDIESPLGNANVDVALDVAGSEGATNGGDNGGGSEVAGGVTGASTEVSKQSTTMGSTGRSRRSL